MSSTERISTLTRGFSTRATSSVVLLVVALVAGAILRFYHLDTNPQGIHPDESLYGYEGWAIKTTGCDSRLTGCPPLYLKGYSTTWDNRTSILYPYMYSLLWRFLPMTTFLLRLPSVLFGLLTIVLVWLIGRRLRPDRSVIAGLAAVLVAITPLAVSWSRIAHDPITVPLFASLIVYSFLQIPRHAWWWMIAGATLALGFYSYQPFKLIGPGVFILTWWYVRPPWTKRYTRWCITAAAVGVITAAPFLYNQITKWTIVQQQFNSLSLFRYPNGWLMVFSNVDLFFWNMLSNPGEAFLFVLPAAIAGSVWVWRRDRRQARFLMLWALIGLSPALITYWVAGTNEMQSRSLGLIGPFELFVAMGIVWLFDRWRRIIHGILRPVVLAIVAALLIEQVIVTGLSNHAYGSFCCFVLGGMEQVANTVDQPPYADRPVVIDFFHNMQGFNLLWTMKIPPAVTQSSTTVWKNFHEGTFTQAQYPAKVGRFSLCDVGECYHPGDGALYVVPGEMLPGLPIVKIFELHFYHYVWVWKIVDNSPRS